MVYLIKKDVDSLVKELSNSSNKKIKNILQKIKCQKKRVYVKDKVGVKRLLQEAFDKKKKVKIRYYSPHSDEFTSRIIEIYKIYTNSIIAYCHLRREERTFIIERIDSATILDEKYVIPKDWSSESIILNK